MEMRRPPRKARTGSGRTMTGVRRVRRSGSGKAVNIEPRKRVSPPTRGFPGERVKPL